MPRIATLAALAALLSLPFPLSASAQTEVPAAPGDGASDGTATGAASPEARIPSTPGSVPPTIVPSGARVVARHGAWAVMCDTPPGAPSEQCGALQEVVSEDRPDLGLTVLVFETADGAARVLRVIAPLNVFLPKGLGLNIDGSDLGRAVFSRCVVEGCQAEVVMDDALVERLSAGTLATFIIFQSPERGTGFPLELAGFADAFRAARNDGAREEPSAADGTPSPADEEAPATDDAAPAATEGEQEPETDG